MIYVRIERGTPLTYTCFIHVKECSFVSLSCFMNATKPKNYKADEKKLADLLVFLFYWHMLAEGEQTLGWLLKQST